MAGWRVFFINPRPARSPTRDEIAILSSVDRRPAIVRLIAPRCPTRVKSSTKQRDTRVSGASWPRTMPGIHRRGISIIQKPAHLSPSSSLLLLFITSRDTPLSRAGECLIVRRHWPRSVSSRSIRAGYCLPTVTTRAISQCLFFMPRRSDTDREKSEKIPISRYHLVERLLLFRFILSDYS